jgi:hypothetical protein
MKNWKIAPATTLAVNGRRGRREQSKRAESRVFGGEDPT